MDTERPSPRYTGIDVWSPSGGLDAMIEGQFAATAAVHAARSAIERAALAMEPRLIDGGRLISMPAPAPLGAWRFRMARS